MNINNTKKHIKKKSYSVPFIKRIGRVDVMTKGAGNQVSVDSSFPTPQPDVS